MKRTGIKENEFITIYLELDEKCAVKMTMSESNSIAENDKWVPIERKKTSIYLNKYQATSQAMKRRQSPLFLFWTCAVHKLYGISLTSAVVSFDFEKQESFNEGQTYFALGRVTNIANLFLGKE